MKPVIVERMLVWDKDVSGVEEKIRHQEEPREDQRYEEDSLTQPRAIVSPITVKREGCQDYR